MIIINAQYSHTLLSSLISGAGGLLAGTDDTPATPTPPGGGGAYDGNPEITSENDDNTPTPANTNRRITNDSKLAAKNRVING